MPWSPIAHERPAWMRVRMQSPSSRYAELDGIIREGGLTTVCEEARCPNIGECWGRGTATFQIMGDTARAPAATAPSTRRSAASRSIRSSRASSPPPSRAWASGTSW